MDEEVIEQVSGLMAGIDVTPVIVLQEDRVHISLTECTWCPTP